MGGKQVKPVYDDPWRKIDWGNSKRLDELMKVKPENDNVQHLRFLLYGVNGAGKSSFINSVQTTLLSRMAIPAAANTSEADDPSFTVQYKSHRMRKGQGSSETYFPFVFDDIMGLDMQNQGIRVEDIKMAMMGHVKDGYKFNPVSPITESDPYYNPEPKLEDTVHVLVCVVDANSPDIDATVVQKMKEVTQAARDLGIPQIAIATHIELLCKEIDKDLRNVYRSRSLEKKMTEISNAIGIPLQCIMAVKNYCDGKTQVDEDMNTLILTILRHMVDFGNDFIIRKIPQNNN